jgi:hypothetical protein
VAYITLVSMPWFGAEVAGTSVVTAIVLVPKEPTGQCVTVGGQDRIVYTLVV